MGDASRPATGYPLQPNGQPPPPSATAYPYQPTYPPAQNPYYYNTQPNYANPRANLFRRIASAIIIVVVLFFIVLFICWLVLRPHYPEFGVTSLSVSNLNVSAAAGVSGSWTARFRVDNPNKKLKISYRDVVSMVYYKSELLAQTRIQSFSQDTKNVTFLNVEYSALDSYLGGKAASDIVADRSRGQVEFNLKVAALVGLKAGGLRMRQRVIRVLCDEVGVGLSSKNGSGNWTGDMRKCRVYW